VNSKVSCDVRDLLRAEERKILNTFPSVERRIAVLELVRSIDHFYLRQNSRPESNTRREEEMDMFFTYGCNKALQLFLDESTQNEMVPLNRSTEESRAWANCMLYHCGQIAVCEMLLDCERAQLGQFVTRDGTIRFEYTERAVGLEAYDAEEFYWLRSVVADHEQSLMDSLMEMLPRIEQIMTPLVRPWRDHYIGYQTTPEIDCYYQQRRIGIRPLQGFRRNAGWMDIETSRLREDTEKEASTSGNLEPVNNSSGQEGPRWLPFRCPGD
jgi:hypothetical protein